VLPLADRALWATALYAGLRRGELLALTWECIDFEGGVVKVVRSWDVKARVTLEPKTNAGRRTVPLASVLRAHLRQHQLASGRRTGLVFGPDGVRPPDADAVSQRALRCWVKAKPKPLARIGLHECRHTFASLMIAAGVNAKALSEYLGHSSITITLDRYGHLMPGNEEQAAGLLDAYLAASEA
jgi:integrase